MVKGFNAESEKPIFIYKPNPAVEGAFEIYGFYDDVQDYEPVGDYTPVTEDEPQELTEGCVTNLIALLNRKEEKMINLENMTSGKLLFQIVDADPNDTEANKYITIMFRTHDGEGVSEENAVFRLEKGVFYERFIKK